MPTSFKTRTCLALYGFVILTLAVGAAAGLATRSGVTGWYGSLAKPSFNPPNWVFAPVWTTLYVLMAVSAWRVWRARGLFAWQLQLFFIQLVLNFAWSFIFFSAHWIGIALVEIVILLVAIAGMAASFLKIDRAAALLLLPYLFWVSFATLLNAELYRLN